MIATSSVTVTVNQTLTSIAVSPAAVAISPLGTQQFTAAAKDQFGNAMAGQPSFTWSVAGGSGSINSATGLYTAPGTGTSAAIRATSGVYGSGTVTVTNQAPLLAASAYPNASPSPVIGSTTNLHALGVDDAGEAALTYTWSAISKPTGAANPTFSINGTNAAKNTVATFTRSGDYTFQVVAADQSALQATGTVAVNVTWQAATIAGRMIFYNDSKFDAHTGYLSGDPAANLYDDNAVASDKTALLPGQTATFANYTSYSRGINGIMIDIQGLAGTPSINNYSQFFGFKVGNDSNPANWSAAPAPIAVNVRQGAARNGSDRVTVIWADNAIQNQWLQVTVLAGASTGLAAQDVFYFGNLVGESGNDATVTVADEDAALNNRTGFVLASITNNYDYNRDGRVNAADALIARALTPALRPRCN